MLSKKKIFFLCIYKMNTFALFTAEEWKKMMLKLQNMDGEIWINQKHLEKKLDIANIADRTNSVLFFRI